jgi:hypothetical protein
VQRCPPDAAGPPPALAAVPQPSPPPDRPARTQGVGELEGLALTVRAPEAAVCGWAAAAAAPGDEPDLGADLADQVRSLLREPRAVVSARLRAVAACLDQAGTPGISMIIADADWLVLNAAGGTLACTVVEISGVSCPVAIAIMTFDAGRAPERGGAPGRRKQRHTVARS